MKFLKYFRYIINVAKLKWHRVKFHYRVFGKSFYILNKGKITLSKNVNLKSYPDGSCHRTALLTYYADAEIEIGINCNLNGTMTVSYTHLRAHETDSYLV